MFKRNRVMRLQPHQFRHHRFPPLVDQAALSESAAAPRAAASAELNNELGLDELGFDELDGEQFGLDGLPGDEFDFSEPADVAPTQANQEDFQVQFNQGFQQGMARGHDEGVQQGIQQGRQQGFEQGIKQGHEQGLEQGFQEGKEHFFKAAAPFGQIQQQAAQLFAEHERRQREQVCELVQKVAQQVIRCELTLQPQQILALVEETLESLPGEPQGLKVQMAREEFAHIEKVASEKIREWNIVCDDSLRQGDCRVVTQSAEADAGCEQRLDRCMQAVESHLLDDQSALESDDVLVPVTDGEEALRHVS